MYKIKFIIADDHPTFREGLRKILEDTEEFECVGQTGDGIEAVSLVHELRPDIILVDIDMPGMNGIEVAKKILGDDGGGVAVIVLSAFDYDLYVLSTLQAGVRGYILKTTPPEELLKALHLIHSGKTVLGVSARDKIKTLVNHGGTAILAEGKHSFLGDRELSVLTMIARGLTNKEIATELDISERTVQAHLANILKKTGTKSRTHAVLYALKGGWIPLYD